MAPPLATFAFEDGWTPQLAPALRRREWEEIRSVLVKWTARGWAVLRRPDGPPLEVADVEALDAAEALQGLTIEAYDTAALAGLEDAVRRHEAAS